jgi:hypothetical protein
MKKKKDKEIKLIDITKIRFSPEFEFELPAKIDAEKLIERGKTLKSWELKGDGSLQNGIELSPEHSNHLFYNKDDLMQIKEILAICRVYKAKALPSCGLHLHIDMKKFSDKDVLHIIKEFIVCQKFIAKTFKVSKERLAETCQFLPKNQIHKLTEKEIHQFRNNLRASFKSYEYLDQKYYSLNASHLPKSDYGTLEFRMFSSTVNFREIKEIIYWTLNFIKRSVERE